MVFSIFKRNRSLCVFLLLQIHLSYVCSLETSGLNEKDMVILVPPQMGAGNMGHGVGLDYVSDETQKLIDEGWRRTGFNQYVSDLIGIRRTLPDMRDEWCKVPSRYDLNLPETDIVICFHNEAWTALLRTIHSILDRTPAPLLRNIILVDDFSDAPYKIEHLKEYWANEPRVKIVRNSKREGLIRSRIYGFQHTTAPVVTFMDSHCECTDGWLQPLLDRIVKNPKTVAVPTIHTINSTSMEFIFDPHTHGFSKMVGSFDWALSFIWNASPENVEKKHPMEPLATPTMAGGLFAISRDFFMYLGMYDPGFEVWGAENLELSFKTWMCGGIMEQVPCSIVGHIFRNISPYEWPGATDVRRNLARLAEVWMDDYAKYFYEQVGYETPNLAGDISERKALRQKLNCKSFEWYLDNVATDVFRPDKAHAKGEIRNLAYGGSICLDSAASQSNIKKIVTIFPCHRQQGNQFWYLTKEGELRQYNDDCLDYSGGDVPVMHPCHGLQGNQQWHFNEKNGLIQHASSLCLIVDESEAKLAMDTCDDKMLGHRWKFENVQTESDNKIIQNI